MPNKELEARIAIIANDLTAKAFASVAKRSALLTTNLDKAAKAGRLPQLTRGFRSMELGAIAAGGAVSRLGVGMAKLAGITSGLAVIYKLGRATAEAAQRIDMVSKASRELGVDIEKLKETINIFSLENIAPEETIQGLKEAATVFEKLHLGQQTKQAKTLAILDPDLLKQLRKPTETLSDAWNDIQAHVNAMTDPGKRHLLSQIFGGDLWEKVAAAGLTFEKISEAADKFRSLGGGQIITKEEGKAVEEMLDAQKNFATAVSALIENALPKLAPEVTKLLTGITEWVAANNKLITSGIVDNMKAMAGLIATAAETARAILNDPAVRVLIDAAASVMPHGAPGAGLNAGIGKMQPQAWVNVPGIVKGLERDLTEKRPEPWINLPDYFNRLAAAADRAAKNLDKVPGAASGVLPNIGVTGGGGGGGGGGGWGTIRRPLGSRGGGGGGGLAAGGPVQKGGWNIVGERGPELVNWGAAGQVFSNAASRSMLSSSHLLISPIGRLTAAISGMGHSMLIPSLALQTPLGRLTAAISGLSTTIGRLNRTLAYGHPGAAGGPSWGRPWVQPRGIAEPGLSSPTVPAPKQPGLSSPMVKPPSFRGPQSTWGGQMAALTKAGQMTPGQFTGGPSANANSWMGYLMSNMGMSKVQAAAVTSNLMGESGRELNPASKGDYGSAFGTGQWRGSRAAGLMALAKQMNKPWTDTGVQQAWFKKEMESQYPKLLERIRGSKDPNAIGNAMVEQYERPAFNNWRQRAAHLPSLLKGEFTATPKTTLGQPVGVYPPMGTQTNKLMTSIGDTAAMGRRGIKYSAPGKPIPTPMAAEKIADYLGRRIKPTLEQSLELSTTPYLGGRWGMGGHVSEEQARKNQLWAEGRGEPSNKYGWPLSGSFHEPDAHFEENVLRLKQWRRPEQAAAQKVDIGGGHLGVTIAMDRSGKPYVKRMAIQHPQNLTIKAAVDKTGRRYWRPGPQP